MTPMTDNGLAALAAAMLKQRDRIEGVEMTPNGADYCAAAILGPRGVFLPDGLDAVREADTLEIIRLQYEWANANGDAMREQDEYHEEILALKISCDAYAGSFERASATIATLRAALDATTEALWDACDCPYHGQDDAHRKVLDNHQPYCNVAQDPINSLLRAALATAKEMP